MSYYLQENGIDRILLEDASGLLLLDATTNASLSETLGALTVAATATVEDHLFVINDPFGRLTLAATGTVKINGTVVRTLGTATLVSTAAIAVKAALARTLGAASLLATGTVAAPAPTGTAGHTGGRPSRKSKLRALQSQYKRTTGELPASLTQPAQPTQGIAIRSSSFGGNRVSLEDFQSKLEAAKAHLIAPAMDAEREADEAEGEEMLMHLLAHLL